MADYDARTLARVQCCNCIPVRCAVILVAVFILIDVVLKSLLCWVFYSDLDRLGSRFIDEYEKQGDEEAEKYGIAFVVMTTFNMLFRVLVYVGMSYYSCK